MKLVTKVKVKNGLGLHTRPATAIVKLLQGRPGDVYFTYRGETINARSILSILMLAAKKNSKITVTVEGDQENEVNQTMQAVLEGFETGFGE